MQHDCPSCGGLTGRDRIITTKISEYWSYLWQQFWHNSRAIVLRLSDVIVWPKEEHIFLFRVPMKVQKHFNLGVFWYSLAKLFKAKHLGKNKLIFCSKLPIEIFPNGSRSGIAENYTIWVYHRYEYCKNSALR